MDDSVAAMKKMQYTSSRRYCLFEPATPPLRGRNLILEHGAVISRLLVDGTARIVAEILL